GLHCGPLFGLLSYYQLFLVFLLLLLRPPGSTLFPYTTLFRSMAARIGAAAVEVIEMRGTERGDRVWFAPRGLAVATGTTLRFVNLDKGNSHTATAYHPALFDRRRRIPAGAQPWDSDFLLPDESFEVTLTAPGVYDYYCLPHEMAGMAGRIVV